MHLGLSSPGAGLNQPTDAPYVSVQDPGRDVGLAGHRVVEARGGHGSRCGDRDEVRGPGCSSLLPNLVVGEASGNLALPRGETNYDSAIVVTVTQAEAANLLVLLVFVLTACGGSRSGADQGASTGPQST
jgi:hypothetical protein